MLSTHSSEQESHQLNRIETVKNVAYWQNATKHNSDSNAFRTTLARISISWEGWGEVAPIKRDILSLVPLLNILKLVA